MSNKEERKAPVLRFKGFTDDWEQRKLKDCLEINSGRDYKHLHSGNIPVFGTGGYMLSVDEALSYKNAIGIGRKGTIDKPQLLIAPFWTVDTLFFLTPENNTDLYFLFSFFQKVNWKKYDESTGLPSLSKKTISTIKIKTPSKNEQIKIGTLIQKVNNLISLQQRKNILLYKLRKSLLSTLLTDKCTPKVRFKSFLEPLKKQKLGDMAPLRGGFAFKANNYVNTGIPIIRISNILSNGSIGGNFAYYSEQSDDSNYILFNGSALIAMSGATTGKTAILDLEKKKKVYQNQRVGYFTPTKNSNYSFIKAIIKSNYFLKQLNSIMVAGAQPNVSAVDIDNFTFYFPESKKEQKYIGNNFEIINKIILLQKNRVDKLKKLKRSLLQQLFI